MAQDILTVSPDAFQLQIRRIASRTLVNLIAGIYAFKWDNRDKAYKNSGLLDKDVLDLERKETLIEIELTRRGWITKANRSEYRLWKMKLQGIRAKRGTGIKTGWTRAKT